MNLRGQKPRIIVAYDGMKYARAMKLAQRLKNFGSISKVNDLLDTKKGTRVLTDLNAFGEVMDDPKFLDTPTTMYNRVFRHAIHSPKFITIHLSNTNEAVQKARRAVNESVGGSFLLGVTVLTTYSTEECEIKLGSSAKAKVLQYSLESKDRIHGIVSSGQELEFLSNYSDLDHLIRVVPGIRSSRQPVKNDDQKRIMYIPEAVELNADYFVIGRPITEAPDPVEAFLNLQQEIDEAWEKLKK